MGTMIQDEQLNEAEFRGELFRDHPLDLKGNNDLLVLTKPELIERIHLDFLEAGADIIETNTFSSTSISQADYQLESCVEDLNVAAVHVAKQAIKNRKSRSFKNLFYRWIDWANQPYCIHLSGCE